MIICHKIIRIILLKSTDPKKLSKKESSRERLGMGDEKHESHCESEFNRQGEWYG